MKAFRLVTILLISVTLFTGCDFFRSLMGKPTSKDIERMRIEAEAQAKKQKQLDSINRANAATLELAAEETNTSKVNEADGRYLVILGSFKNPSNAERMHKFLVDNGYTPKTLKFKNGFDVVSIFASNDYRQARAEMRKVLDLEFCPEDIWIYDLQQGLHE